MAKDTNTQSKLQEKAVISGQPLTSDTAGVGPLIARIRNAWNNVAARWYVDDLFRKQTTFNQTVVGHVEAQEDRLITFDRAQVEATHDVAELRAMVQALSKRVRQLEAKLEAKPNAS